MPVGFLSPRPAAFNEAVKSNCTKVKRYILRVCLILQYLYLQIHFKYCKSLLVPVLKKFTILLKKISMLEVMNFTYLENSLTWNNIFY